MESRPRNHKAGESTLHILLQLVCFSHGVGVCILNVVKAWSPACVTFRRLGLVGGSKVTGGGPLKGILGPGPFLSLLLGHHEVNSSPCLMLPP
jgi:hypothetical protein